MNCDAFVYITFISKLLRFNSIQREYSPQTTYDSLPFEFVIKKKEVKLFVM